MDRPANPPQTPREAFTARGKSWGWPDWYIAEKWFEVQDKTRIAEEAKRFEAWRDKIRKQCQEIARRNGR